MPNLFGLDIAQLVADGIAEAGNLRPGTLTHFTKGTRTVGQLTSGTNPLKTSHTFQGFVEKRTVRRKGQIGKEQMSVVTLLGATVSPAVVPDINDKALIDGVTYLLHELLERDPAGAVYEFVTED